MRITGTRLVGLFALVTTLGGSVVEASTISWGTPVDGIGSSTTVGDFGNWYDSTPDGVSNPTDHWVKYYIPLTEPYSGTYGDGTTGMQSDYIQNGCGPGTSNVCGYLDVYLQFEPIAPLPLESALMSFEFADLDIAPINDPWFFFESVRFYSAEGTAISDEITGLELGTGETNGIEWNAYQNLPEGMESTDPEADDWPLFVDFYGTEFTNLITDPFWVKLKFAVQDIPSWGLRQQHRQVLQRKPHDREHGCFPSPPPYSS